MLTDIRNFVLKLNELIRNEILHKGRPLLRKHVKLKIRILERWKYFQQP